MSKPPERFVVGYVLAPKKQLSFIKPSLLDLARSRGIDLVAVDPAVPLSDQGPFHCILHKLYADDWNAQLHQFSITHPGVPIVDPPFAIERLRNRISMLQFVSDLQIPQTNHTFGIPTQVVVHHSDALSDSSALALRFPVVAKPLVADGSAKSHKMSLVFRRDGLLKLKPPLVLQEFVNHGGVIFKVYVVGDFVQCVKRKSLPDVSDDDKLGCSQGFMTFSQISNMTNTARDQDEYLSDLNDAEMPPLNFVTDIARGLSRAMGLRLFNFDVIRDVKAGNRYLVIDINYFPGYAKMPSYETVLTDFFWNIVHRREGEDEAADSGCYEEVEAAKNVG